ncbi:MAG TPA: fasciclin domain-containing protein [Tenuifilaceae bacterium]|nr:fasciclin domain-containing protein [Tenuifilaceae bacterium]
MKTRKTLFTIIAVLGIVSTFALTSCESDDDAMEKPKNIVEVAVSNSDFSTLVAALQKAEIVTALQADGPFTVFAPTNAAFNQLFTDLGVDGIDDLTKEQLTPILLYHVIGAKVKSTDLTNGYVTTLSTGTGNKNVSLKVDATNLELNGGVGITSADINATNGVIHVVDKVLLPPTVVDIALDNDNFSILVSALAKAELVETLKGDGPFTVFAPTNDAFNALFEALDVTGIADLTKEALTPILLDHVVSGNVRSTDLTTGTVNTLNNSISIDVSSGVKINGDINVVLADVQGTNGVVHVIDKVIVTPTK